jgi:SSS family solute:Na+ symporter
MDFIRPEERGWTGERIALAGRICVVGFMLLAALIAPLIQNFPGLFHYLQSALAYLVPPVVVVFLLGLFWRGANGSGAFAALLGGHGVSAVLFLLSLLDLLSLHFTIVAGLLALASLVIAVVASRRGAPPGSEQISRYTAQGRDIAATAGLAWWQDYRLYSVLVLGLATALVAAHW